MGNSLFFLLQKETNPLAKRFGSGDVMFLTILHQLLMLNLIKAYFYINILGIVRFWSACSRRQFFTSFRVPQIYYISWNAICQVFFLKLYYYPKKCATICRNLLKIGFPKGPVPLAGALDLLPPKRAAKIGSPKEKGAGYPIESRQQKPLTLDRLIR